MIKKRQLLPLHSYAAMEINPSESDSSHLEAVLFGTPLDTPSACGGVVHYANADGIWQYTAVWAD